MTALSAKVVPFASSRRAPDAGPVHKLRVMEECRRRVQAREVRRTAIAVLGYISECIDKETGLATLRLRTIAEATTYSRGEVGKAVKELVAAGLVEHVSNRRGNECLAASFRLLDPAAGGRQARRFEATTPSPVGDTSRMFEKPSPDCSDPDGLVRGREPPANFAGGPADNLSGGSDFGPFSTSHIPPAASEMTGPPRSARQNAKGAESAALHSAAPPYDWAAATEWLATQGNYRRWGPGSGEAYELASIDLDRWHERHGEQRVIAAINVAKAGNDGRGWFGSHKML